MGGSLLVIGGTGGRRPASVLRSSAPTPPRSRVMVANLALELAPIRVNLSLPGSSTAPVRNAARRPARRAPRLAARHASDRTRRRRAALGVHVKTNTALTGATDDVEGA